MTHLSLKAQQTTLPLKISNSKIDFIKTANLMATEPLARLKPSSKQISKILQKLPFPTRSFISMEDSGYKKGFFTEFLPDPQRGTAYHSIFPAIRIGELASYGAIIGGTLGTFSGIGKGMGLRSAFRGGLWGAGIATGVATTLILLETASRNSISVGE